MIDGFLAVSPEADDSTHNLADVQTGANRAEVQ